MALNTRSIDEENQNSKLLELVRVEIADIGLSEFAQRSQIDASNLAKIIMRKRNMSLGMAKLLERYYVGG